MAAEAACGLLRVAHLAKTAMHSGLLLINCYLAAQVSKRSLLTILPAGTSRTNQTLCPRADIFQSTSQGRTSFHCTRM